MNNIIRTDPHPFGLIIPAKTGIIWEHQCDGHLCNQIQQEGIFIPLSRRYFKYDLNDEGDAEYYYEDEDMPFKFRDVTFDNDKEKDKLTKRSLFQLFMQEAYAWIIFKGWKDKNQFNRLKKFIGKKVLLVYQNSD